jgi:preprotein translocase subunit SecF
MQLLVDPKFDFIGRRKMAIIFSGALILISIGSVIIHGGPNYGIDFLGGTSMTLLFNEAPDITDVRNAVSASGYGGAEIKRFGAPNDILIRVQDTGEDDVSIPIIASLTKAFPDNPFEQRSVEKVGPKIGAELKTDAVLAVLFAMFFILLYISWRFEFVFAVGAIVALFHDIIITLGIFSLLQLEVTLAIIAAFLTIVGYSLNDTIVVFDRIRENLKVLRRDAYEAIVNKSLNQSLSRTIVTSMTTLLVVVILYFFGGEVIKNFAFALIVGVVIGTYSSIFVASPILIEWQARREVKGRPAAKRA